MQHLPKIREALSELIEEHGSPNKFTSGEIARGLDIPVGFVTARGFRYFKTPTPITANGKEHHVSYIGGGTWIVKPAA